MVNRACAIACAIVNTPALVKAAVDTVCDKVIAVHHLGLEIGDQAYLVAYEDRKSGTAIANLIIGPRGLIALAYRSGTVRSIYATSVFKADVDAKLFSYNQALGEIHHEKATTGRRTGGKPENLIMYSYCVVHTTTGGRIVEVLTAEDLAYYRGFSTAKSDKSPWFTNYEGMARKTAIKRGLEFVPRSPLMAAALKENEAGAYEIPEEMWEAAKQCAAGLTAEQVPEQITADERDQRQAAAIDRGADPEADGR